MYADDTQLYMSLEPSNVLELQSNLEKCIDDVKYWMLINKLKLNEEKTESILCNPKSFDVSLDHVNVGEEKIYFNTTGKNLGVVIDNNLDMSHHISNICKSVYLELCRLRHMSNFVSQASLKMLASSFILSRLDYCNSLLQYLPQVQTNRLQKLQNHAARIICRRPIRDHVTPLLVYLHWLPVTARIDYKILALVYKCKHNLSW